MAFRTKASLSRRSKSPSPPQDDEEDANLIYSCALEVESILGVSKLTTLVGRYQIPLEFKPRLPESGEWCCSPLSSFGVYASYLLAGLRFPLNYFYRGLFHMLGIGPNQLNLNGWRTIVAMQVLQHEVFEGNRPMTMDEFLFAINPQKSNSLLVFTSSRLGTHNLVKLGVVVLQIGHGRKNFSSTLASA